MGDGPFHWKKAMKFVDAASKLDKKMLKTKQHVGAHFLINFNQSPFKLELLPQ